MIAPEKYNTLPEPMEALAERVEDEILQSICKRIAQDGYITATSEIQISALIDRGWSANDLMLKIAQLTDKSFLLIMQMYEDAAEESQRFDEEVYKKLGKKPVPIEKNERIQAEIKALAEQTHNTFRDFTGSLGFSVNRNGKMEFLPLAKAYRYILDRAQMEILSGGFTGQEAIKRAVKDLAASGVKTVSYASGHADQLDVAVRRASVTGLNQIAEKMNDQTLEDFESPLVEVSAHGGARDKGTGWQNHKSWQGKVYYWKEKDKWNRADLARKYPDFVSVTGYGQVDGIEGANCRHSKRVFVDGVSERMYTDKQLQSIDDPDFEYNGVKYSTYEATQRQRLLERTQRKYKRILRAFDEIGVKDNDEDYIALESRLEAVKKEYRNFSKAAELRLQPERARVDY